MPFPLIIEQVAKTDIRSAKEWLDEQRPGLGQQFREELEQAFNRIASNPLAFAIIERRTRQLRLRVLTYVVSYIFFENKVHVTAVLHGHRDPREWKKRS